MRFSYLLSAALALSLFAPRPAAAQTEVWSWGANDYGQLGDGTGVNSLVPVRTPGLQGVVEVSARGPHTLARTFDGAVWGWGRNNFGQLGDGTSGNTRATPVQAVGLPPVAHVATGDFHSLALAEDGSFWAWGWNSHGQLGLGGNDRSNRATPTQIPRLSGGAFVAGGANFSLAAAAGSAWAWGDTIGPFGVPTQVAELSDVVAVSGGALHAMALKADGTVWCWGFNGNGQLGDGTRTDHAAPGQVPNLTDIIAIAGGTSHSLALKADGTVWAWGHGGFGELGDGTGAQRLTPVQVSGLTNVVAIAAGVIYSLALRADGTVWTWGYNADGELGDGTTISRLAPVQVQGLQNVIALDGGSFHGVAIVNPQPWNINGDGGTDEEDLGIVLQQQGTRLGVRGFDFLADVNHDAVVDDVDLGLVLAHMGE